MPPLTTTKNGTVASPAETSTSPRDTERRRPCAPMRAICAAVKIGKALSSGIGDHEHKGYRAYTRHAVRGTRQWCCGLGCIHVERRRRGASRVAGPADRRRGIATYDHRLLDRRARRASPLRAVADEPMECGRESVRGRRLERQLEEDGRV